MTSQGVAEVQVPTGIRLAIPPLRSTNLERDLEEPQLPDLYVGARATDTLERILAALEDTRRTRAWSLTGPYGSGKSTLALLLDALLGVNTKRREQAVNLVESANPSLARRLEKAREDRAPQGFIGAVATARREALVTTLTRALRAGIDRRWPSRKIPARVSTAMDALSTPGSSSAELLDVVKALCSAKQPLLIIIDEFGKTLEHLASHRDFANANDDLFLLQELAELGAGTSGLPLHIVTLQHLSFLDYASRSTTLQSREWAKIQGRFEDITFNTHLGDAVHLITQSLIQSDVSASGMGLIEKQAAAAHSLWPDRGLQGVLPGDSQLFASLYPLHPLTALAAPLLAAQVGQNDRSLSGFLAGDEPHTVRRFLTTHSAHVATKASTVRLFHLYDYFLASGRTTVLASANASRWIEIDLRISEAHGLSNEDKQVLKTVGLLNLIDSSGALRASADMVLFALTDPADTQDTNKRLPLLERIDELVDKGFLVYRDFSDEYRIWQGTDIDLKTRLDEIRDQCTDNAVIQLLTRRIPGAVVAGRHSQQTGMLRHFVTTVSTANSKDVSGPQIEDPADGLLLFHLGEASSVPSIKSSLPAAIGMTDQAEAVLEAGKELLALEELLGNRTLDAVARREVIERTGQAAAHLASTISEAFTPTRAGTTWHLMRPQAGHPYLIREDVPLTARSLAGVVSLVCESVYDHTPHVRNEMLGRHQLTSQGAKARRELLLAMVAHPGEEFLGIEGYGPERAMYSGALAYMGLHGPYTSTSETELVQFGFIQPSSEDPLAPAWDALNESLSIASNETSLDEVLRILMAPPYGIKAGVVPLVVTTALLLRSQDIAVFEEGTYRPRLTADIVERLIKAPSRFSVKATPSTTGQRQLVLSELAEALSIPSPKSPSRGSRRNIALLSLARGLLDYARILTPYGRQTRNISQQAAAVRDALIRTRDPDDMVFSALPKAVGLSPITLNEPRDETRAKDYVQRLSSSLTELSAITNDLRAGVIANLAESFRLSADLPTLRKDLAARARGFADTMLESQLKGLVSIALNDVLTDEDWLDPLVIRISGTALNNWTDAQADAFKRQALETARSLDRVSHLYQAAHLGDDTGTAQTQLVTVTTPEGYENRVLAYIPDGLQETVRSFTDAILRQANSELGPDGGRVLLAALAQSLVHSGAQDSVIDN
ncbi:ATP-binding protein [Sphaerisporangium sp. NPDC051011]|uniref:ATP-binding protein n=1 Tax=Sphaerisporangium sp. NPDC051011 TaxID=3155792 RepID=UPI0033C2F0C2